MVSAWTMQGCIAKERLTIVNSNPSKSIKSTDWTKKNRKPNKMDGLEKDLQKTGKIVKKGKK